MHRWDHCDWSFSCTKQDPKKGRGPAPLTSGQRGKVCQLQPPRREGSSLREVVQSEILGDLLKERRRRLNIVTSLAPLHMVIERHQNPFPQKM
jgi:hypothetical protein